MSTKNRIAAIAAILFAVLPLNVLAQDGGLPASTPMTTTKIAVISIQSAIVATNYGRKEFQDLDKRFEPQKSQIKLLNDEMDRLKKQLEAQEAVTNEETRAALAKQIDNKQRVLNRTQEDAQNDYSGQQSEIVQKVVKKLLPIIDRYAKENGLSLVVDGSKSWPEWPVLWASSSIDITNPVVAIYNAQTGASEGADRSVPHDKSTASSPKTQVEAPVH